MLPMVIINYYDLIPLLLITFGLLTTFSIRQRPNRVATIIASNRNCRRKGQLARLLFTYIITSLFPSTQTQLMMAIQQISIP
jgi:hypothetical protein